MFVLCLSGLARWFDSLSGTIDQGKPGRYLIPGIGEHASTAPLHPDQKTVRKSLIPFSPYPSVQPQSDQSCFI
ncbi:conserved hypothetical protein [Aspergillus fumigatus A1163]|uniref:Uncharacterized protein n=1 Tax=Aspergillus fumigatus (strain CBS 144.89 / FGSC A1163 / CEA10) TaxID=451804 RepID=B0XW92_ASPFC|nr:conserved hypothetical protein [Aspergillus fumigatus A1163]